LASVLQSDAFVIGSIYNVTVMSANGKKNQFRTSARAEDDLLIQIAKIRPPHFFFFGNRLQKLAASNIWWAVQVQEEVPLLIFPY
jgi:hypothetical protein